MKSFYASVLLALLPFLPLAAGIFDLIPSRSGQVLRIRLPDSAEKGAVIREDVLQQFFRLSGLDEEKVPRGVLLETIEEVLIVTPVLMEDYTLIFVKTKVSEEVFCRRLTEQTGLPIQPVTVNGRTEKRLNLPAVEFFPGVPAKPRTIVFTFLEKNIAVFAKDSLADYLAGKRNGLSPAKQRNLASAGALVTGFIEPNFDFLKENPFFPPLRLMFYSLAGDSSGGLRIRVYAECLDEKSATQVQMQIQQYVMLGGILLNQAAPELAPMWVSMIRVRRNNSDVFLEADLSAEFIMGLSAASDKLSANLNLPSDPPKSKTN